MDSDKNNINMTYMYLRMEGARMTRKVFEI